MSREKQIEEMAKVIYGRPSYDTFYQSNCEYLATDLYNAGYVKASDVAEEIFAEMESTIKGIIVLLSFSYNDSPKESYLKKACYKDMLGFLAELKKKYESEKDK